MLGAVQAGCYKAVTKEKSKVKVDPNSKATDEL